MDNAPRLTLLTPVIAEPDQLAGVLRDALDAAPVAAVLLRLAASDERAMTRRLTQLVSTVQRADVAALLFEPADGDFDLGRIVARAGADGLHVRGLEAVHRWRDQLRDGRTLGVGGLATRHDGMEAGEAGADYVLFGEPGPGGRTPPFDLVEESAAWWAEIFQIPCVAFAPRLADIPGLAATGAEFVAVGDAVWGHPAGPAAALAEASRLLRAPAPEAAS